MQVNKKILVVDDNEINLKLLERLIKGYFNYEVLCARDGKEAVELAEQHKPSIIFMDMMMPVLDGYQATTLIKQMADMKDVPVIAVSAVNNKEGIKSIYECGCEDILPKPVDVEVVIQIVNKFISKN